MLGLYSTGLRSRMEAKMNSNVAVIRARGDSIRRYQRLLQTRLTDLEREYIEGRFAVERSLLKSIDGSQGELGADGTWQAQIDNIALTSP